MKTENLRKHQLSFCLVCKNKKHTLKEGVICGLTNQIADFENVCDNYLESKELLEERKSKVKQIIYDKYPKQNIINEFIASQYYKSSSEIDLIPTKKNKNITSKVDPTKFKVLFFAFLLITIFYTFKNFDKLLSFNNNSPEVYNFLGLIFILGLIYYVVFIKKFTKDTIKINDAGIYFRYSKYGFKHENIFLKWHEILEYGILTIPSKNGYTYKIIIGTKSLEIFNMDVTFMDITPTGYISIIKEKLKKVG